MHWLSKVIQAPHHPGKVAPAKANWHGELERVAESQNRGILGQGEGGPVSRPGPGVV